MSTTFEEFYQKIGFVDFPFFDSTSENEDTTSLFIKPLNYSVLENIFSKKRSAIICGNRGTGKTIIIKDLLSKSSNRSLVSFITNFESIPIEKNQLDFYSLILQNLTDQLLQFLSVNKKVIKKLSYDEKVFLSFLIKKYGDSITEDQLSSKIENVQLNYFQKFVNKLSTPITFILNYTATSVTNFGNDILTKHFGNYLPNVNEGSIRSIFPAIKFPVQEEFKSVEITYALLEKSLKLISKIICSKPIIFIDKLDEDSRLENDAELIKCFIKELICDQTLLSNENIQIFISVWKIPFSKLDSTFRHAKQIVHDLNWNETQLESVLNRRIYVYSEKKLSDYKYLFSQDINSNDLDNLFNLSNYNPRDLWAILKYIYTAQYEINPHATTISADALKRGMNEFVANFKFYEYYPKQKGATRKANDVYDYISHLSKLYNTDEFTNAELKDAASTGGSTTNYITSMMNIGLIYKTSQKRPGGAVIYKIKDPKVVYAIFNNIDITHS